MKEDRSVVPPLDAVLATVVSIILSIFLGAVFYFLFGEAFVLIAGELLLAVVPLGYMLYRKINIKSYIGLDVKPQKILLGISLGAFIFLFDLFISTILVSIFGPSKAVEESQNLIINMSSSSEGLIIVIAALSLAGICEEFTFRGFLQTAVSSKHHIGIALLASSLAFGFIHFDPQAIYTISAFFIGLLLGYIHHRWHSYVVSAVAHMTVNLIVLTILLVVI